MSHETWNLLVDKVALWSNFECSRKVVDVGKVGRVIDTEEVSRQTVYRVKVDNPIGLTLKTYPISLRRSSVQ